MAALGLLPAPVRALLDGKLGEGLPGRELVPLALTGRGRPTRAEDRLKVVTGRLVGRNDGELARIVRHDETVLGRPGNPKRRTERRTDAGTAIRRGTLAVQDRRPSVCLLKSRAIPVDA